LANANPPAQDVPRIPTYDTAAKELLDAAKIRDGFCLIIGAETGELARELALKSNLQIYGVEPDAAKVEEARRKLMAEKLYGTRVTIHQGDLSAIPYANYFANLIVSDTLFATGEMPGDPEVLARHLKPCGGKIVLWTGTVKPAANLTIDKLNGWLAGTKLTGEAEVSSLGSFAVMTRGKLPGAGEWTHLYANPGNIATTEDYRIKGGLGVLWYGDPGPGKMVNRHDGAVGPLAVNGRLIVQGENSIMAYDSYNGQFLWERDNSQAFRTGVFQNQNPGNLAASEDFVFVMVKDVVEQIDAATGELVATHKLPEGRQENREWGYLAYQDGRLFGTASVRTEVEQRLRRRGRRFEDATDVLFAIDVKTGKHLWQYQGQSIVHHTIALGPNRAYLIDSTLTPEQRQALLDEDKTELAKLTGEEAKLAEDRMKRLDARLAVGLDAQTGEKLWETPVDVTDCSVIGTGGGQLTMLFHNNTLVLCGANANGHYWKQFIEGEFSKRRLVCLSAEDGHELWAKDANYRHRPIIIEDQIIAEPWSYDLYTGEIKTRPHPLTGEAVPWSIMRTGHHCGMLTGTPSMLMFRSGFTGFYDLDADDGTQHFAGHRLGCWINMIPANGLVMIPEASAGCVCQFSIASTIALEPRAPRHPWTIYSTTGANTPVERMALNLGAPGDRKDSRDQLWISYPRPKP
jgi:outer membrane protein assembly factor BamB